MRGDAGRLRRRSASIDLPAQRSTRRGGSSRPAISRMRRVPVSSALSASDSSGTAPRPRRSSGHEAQAERAARGGAAVGPTAVPSMRDRIRRGAGALARQRRHQLLLAVAGDAGDADDLAGAHLEGDVLQVDAERVSRGAAIRSRTSAGARRRRRACAPAAAAELRADHQLGHAARGLAARIAVADDPAAAQHVALWQSARISSSLWLM